MINAKADLGLRGGLIACPIPWKDEIPSEEINSVIDQAVKECEEQGVKARKITPFLLSRVKDTYKGPRSLEANIKLVLDNNAIGSKIANNL